MSDAAMGASIELVEPLRDLFKDEVRQVGLELGVPDYSVDESGPDHAKTFRARVTLATEVWGEGEGRSKKEAEQAAAQENAAARAAEKIAKKDVFDLLVVGGFGERVGLTSGAANPAGASAALIDPRFVAASTARPAVNGATAPGLAAQ